MIEELDNLKTKSGDLGFKARRAIRKIEEFMSSGNLSVEYSIDKKNFPDFLDNKNQKIITDYFPKKIDLFFSDFKISLKANKDCFLPLKII